MAAGFLENIQAKVGPSARKKPPLCPNGTQLMMAAQEAHAGSCSLLLSRRQQ
jgi:hypothetical protein